MSIAHSGNFDTNLGVIVPVRDYFSRTEARRRRTSQEALPPPLELNALIDTGAECSCLNPTFAEKLALPLFRAKLVNAPDLGGLSFNRTFDASLTVMHPSGDPHLNYQLPNLPLLELNLNFSGYDVLIGRDVLSRCTFIYDGRKRSFTLEY